MVLIVNGETTTAAATDLAGLLAELDHGEESRVAVALNHEVIPRRLWSSTKLREGDAVEIISPRQGG